METGLTIVAALMALMFYILWQLTLQGNKNMGESLDRLREEVEQTQSAVDSIVIFTAGIANRLREALMGENADAEISALADELDGMQREIATSITANTVAENDSSEFDSSEVDGDDELYEFEPDEPEIAVEPITGEAESADGAVVEGASVAVAPASDGESSGESNAGSATESLDQPADGAASVTEAVPSSVGESDGAGVATPSAADEGSEPETPAT